MPKCPNWPEHLPLNEGAIKVKPSKTKTNLEILKIEKSPKKKIQENCQCGRGEFSKVENDFLHIPRGLLVSSKDRKRLFSSDPNSMKCLSALLWLFFSKRRNAAFFFSLRFSMEEGTDHRSNTPGQVKRFCWPRPPTCSYLNEWNGREKPKKKNKGGDEPSSRGLVGGVT